jgi:hypothetical protein
MRSGARPKRQENQMGSTRFDTSPEDDSDVFSFLLRGRKRGIPPEQGLREQDLLEAYFLSITAEDIEEAVAVFEHSLDFSERKEAAQALIAYFDWCWRRAKDSVRRETGEDQPALFGDPPAEGRAEDNVDQQPDTDPAGTEPVSQPNDRRTVAPVDQYVLRFTQIVFARIVGGRTDANDVSSSSLLPRWTDPDIAFGWRKHAHRPLQDNSLRDLGIAAYAESLKRKGVDPGDAKKRAAIKFEVGVATVDKAVQVPADVKLEFGQRFNKFSTSELDDLVQEALHDLEARRREE